MEELKTPKKFNLREIKRRTWIFDEI